MCALELRGVLLMGCDFVCYGIVDYLGFWLRCVVGISDFGVQGGWTAWGGGGGGIGFTISNTCVCVNALVCRYKELVNFRF